MPEFELGDYYDEMIDWGRRLKREGPFYDRLFKQRQVKSVLDCACGTGRHARMFADWGFDVTASDIDERMLAQTRERCGSKVRVVAAGFAALPDHFTGEFDAVVCVGNSLSAVTEDDEYKASLDGMAAATKPGGLVVLHVLNAAAHANDELSFSPIHEIEHGGRRGPVVRWRYRHDRHLMAATVFVEKLDDGWRLHSRARPLRAFWPDELADACRRAGLSVDGLYGDYAFTALDAETHKDLIVVATRTG
jgi:glycine/sarcosine N-methyltransferase